MQIKGMGDSQFVKPIGQHVVIQWISAALKFQLPFPFCVRGLSENLELYALGGE
jgi:hypothetical protein